MKIVAFEWDNFQGEEHNGRHLIVGDFLNEQEEDFKSIKVNGFTLDLIDTTKDNQLKSISAYSKNLVGKIVEISKEEVRKRLISEIDKNLDILFNPKEQ